MKYINSQTRSDPVSFSTAIINSLPTGDGLYIPSHFPHPPTLNDQHFAHYADQLIADFIQDDPYFQPDSTLFASSIPFSPTITKLHSGHHLLELFHGPSLSFKDFGAQFLAECLQHIPQQKHRLIMVATSGDTGSAVAAAFHQKPNTNVVILYPANGVSTRQAQQLGCWGDNITTLAIDNDFDTCQALVKTALADADLSRAFEITTANSINIGRLLAQAAYYAYSSAAYTNEHHQPANIIVPSGNLGNVTACCWAKAMGSPINHIVIAQNANKAVVDYCETGEMLARPTIQTLANAMDVGSPSNFKRLQSLYPNHQQFCESLHAYSVSDQEIKDCIIQTYHNSGVIICPHTATAVSLLPQLKPMASRWLIAATAHPGKFEAIIEPLIKRTIDLPEHFIQQLNRPNHSMPLADNYTRLKEIILQIKLQRS